MGDDDAGGVHPGEEVSGKVADELGLDEHHVAVAEVPERKEGLRDFFKNKKHASLRTDAVFSHIRGGGGECDAMLHFCAKL